MQKFYKMMNSNPPSVLFYFFYFFLVQQQWSLPISNEYKVYLFISIHIYPPLTIYICLRPVFDILQIVCNIFKRVNGEICLPIIIRHQDLSWLLIGFHFTEAWTKHTGKLNDRVKISVILKQHLCNGRSDKLDLVCSSGSKVFFHFHICLENWPGLFDDLFPFPPRYCGVEGFYFKPELPYFLHKVHQTIRCIKQNKTVG